MANLPGRVGELVGDMLAAEGHDVRRVATAGEARSQIIIIEDDARITVLNEPGPVLTEADLDSLLGALLEELPGHRVVAASGSLPPGAPDDAYGRVVMLAADGPDAIEPISGMAHFNGILVEVTPLPPTH